MRPMNSQADPLGQALAVYQMFNQGQAQQHGDLDQVLGLLNIDRQDQAAKDDRDYRTKSLDLEDQKNREYATFRQGLIDSKDKSANLDPQTKLTMMSILENPKSSPGQQQVARSYFSPQELAQLDQRKAKQMFDLGLITPDQAKAQGYDPGVGSSNGPSIVAKSTPQAPTYARPTDPAPVNEESVYQEEGSMAPLVDKATSGLYQMFAPYLNSVLGSMGAPQVPDFSTDLTGAAIKRITAQRQAQQVTQ